MKKELLTKLSRRERQIVDVLYQKGEATAGEVLEALPDPPSYSSVRALLAILKDKGLVKHEQRGRVYVYSPTVSRSDARHAALRHLVKTFFGGSTEQVVAALMSMSDTQLTDDEVTRLRRLIDEKRKGGK